jgi:hypothetical protein
MTTVLVPHPKDVRDMFEGILGRDVDVAPGEPVVPTAAAWAGVGAYVEDNLTLSAAIAADLALTAYAGAALGLVPPASAAQAITDYIISDAIWENFAEVLSIGSTLLNNDGAPHVRLYASFPPGETPQADIAGLLHGLGRRLDLKVTISGYGSGMLSVVRAF